MDQRGFWALLRRRWTVVVAFMMLGVIAGSVYILATPPEYTAETELFVATVGADSTSDLAQGSNFSQQQARNYSVVAQREIVLDPVITALGLETTARELAGRVSASVPLNTSLISIAVTDSSPTRAAATANAISTSLANTVIRLVPKRSDGSSPVHLQSVQTAATPAYPSAPNARIVLIFAAMAGLLVGCAFIVVRELVSARVRSVEHLKQLTGLTVLGTVGYDRGTPQSPLFTQSSDLSPRAEEFRQLRTNLHFLHPGLTHKVFVVTSSVPGEGKSTTSANLAVALAAAGTSTCLVEADLRKPVLGSYLDLESSVGLTTVLAGDVDLDDALQPWGPHRLNVLLSGLVPPNPSELLGSAEAQRILTELQGRFDAVVIDCPPLGPVTDAAIVARAFGGAIMVVGLEKVDVRDLMSAIDSLKTSGAPVLGVIANFAPVTSRGRYQAYSQTDPPPPTRQKPLRSRKERETVPT